MRFRRKLLHVVGISAAVAFSVGGLSLAYGFPIPNDPGGHEHTLRTLLPEDCGTYLSGAEGAPGSRLIPTATPSQALHRLATRRGIRSICTGFTT
jgi:hypothetical protein